MAVKYNATIAVYSGSKLTYVFFTFITLTIVYTWADEIYILVIILINGHFYFKYIYPPYTFILFYPFISHEEKKLYSSLFILVRDWYKS